MKKGKMKWRLIRKVIRLAQNLSAHVDWNWSGENEQSIFTPQRVVIVGLGGIGSNLVGPLFCFLAYHKPALQISLVEGKDFSERNLGRQQYCRVGMNKAEAITEEMRGVYPRLSITPHPYYVDDDVAAVLIKEKDIVFACVDNHATRKVLSDRVSMLRNGALISGGNNLEDGGDQFHLRCANKDLTPPITFLHDEIKYPEDRNPAHLGCDEIAEGQPQIIVTNNLAASLMFAAFWNILQWSKGKSAVPAYTEQHFDIPAGIVKPYDRNTENS